MPRSTVGSQALAHVRCDIMTKPHDDGSFDLGAGLQAPTVGAHDRAQKLLEKLLAGAAAQAQRAQLNERAAAAVPEVQFAPRPFGGGRRYDIALSMVTGAPWWSATSEDDAAPLPGIAVPAAPASASRAQEASRGQQESHWDNVPTQQTLLPTELFNESTSPMLKAPPPFAPTVRKSAPVPHAADVVTQELLEQTADTALLMNQPDGTASFQIAFRDEVFADLACTISRRSDGQIAAVFQVEDDNLRRLLEAETGRLRNNFEARGLKVADIKVVVTTR